MHGPMNIKGLVRLLDPEDEGTATVRTVENYWPDVKESQLEMFTFSDNTFP